MRRLAWMWFLFVAGSLAAQESPKKRDLSFLVPGQTRYAEVVERWRDSGGGNGALGEWKAEVAREKPDILLYPLSAPNRPDPPEGHIWIESSPEERAKWHLVRVHVCEYSVVVAESPVDDPDRPEVTLVFYLDDAGSPDRLFYYRVTLGSKRPDWDAVVRQNGRPMDENYVYVQEWTNGEKRDKYVFRRFPALGVGYVWDAQLAEELVKKGRVTTDEAEREFYVAILHFEPEKK